MKKLLLLLALVNASAFAAAAQTPPPAHGLTLGSPEWASFMVTASFGAGGGRRRGGMGRTYNQADRQPHMEQALANALPRDVPESRGVARSLRHASVAMTNAGAKTVKSFRLDFVFKDPATGAEVNRIHHRSRKRLRPGESALTRKEVMGSARHRRGDGMQVSAEVTEVVYEDGSVWRR